MRIGIVTVQDVSNFGSYLQAYALQSFLEEKGHDVVFIRSSTRKYVRGLFYRIRPYRKEWRHLPTFVSTNFYGWKKHLAFLKDQKAFTVIEQDSKNECDLVILGSDEIWNVQNPLFRDPVFYGKDMRSVMTYGASIGDARADEMQCIDQSQFANIKPILARDSQTLQYLHGIGIKAERVCDPTLLVGSNLFQREYHHPLMKRPYLLLYAYSHQLSEAAIDSIKAFAEENGLSIISACFRLDWCDGVINCSPLDFCAVLKQAAYVVTSTFHGTIFSILNHKQFACIAYSLKTIDLLDSLNLQSRLIIKEDCTVDKLSNMLLSEHIDYAGVDLIIETQRERSSWLLCNAIKEKQSG